MNASMNVCCFLPMYAQMFIQYFCTFRGYIVASVVYSMYVLVLIIFLLCFIYLKNIVNYVIAEKFLYPDRAIAI